MRIESLGVLALALACSSSPDEPGGAAGSGGTSSGGSSAPSGGSSPSGGSAMTSGGSPGNGAPTGGTSAVAGATTGGKPAGGAGASAGAPSGGAGAGSGGASGRGGAAGAGNGGGGSGSCAPNLGCKLDPPPTTGDLQQDCVDRINQFLTQCACLPALKRRTDGEACANEMAKYDADHNEAHAGIRAKICQPGGSQNSCPGYSSNTQVVGLCLQQMWDEGPPPTANCTGECYETHGHYINMTDPEVTQVACGFYTTASGKVWAVQNFSR